MSLISKLFAPATVALPPIYAIVLAEEPHRTAAFETHLAEQSLEATCVTGFHGLTLGLRPTTPFNITESGETQYLHYGAIGCCLSHLCALRVALAEGADDFIVMEDDALLCPCFAERFAELRSACPSDTNVISLELFDTDRTKPGEAVNSLCRRLQWPFGSVALWWKREAALFALRAIHPISLPYDISLMNLVYPFCHLVVADPPLVRQRSVHGNWPSTVQPEKAAVQ